MSDVRPVQIRRAGVAANLVGSSDHLQNQWRTRLGGLGLRTDPQSRNRIIQNLTAMREPVSRGGAALFRAAMVEHYHALHSFARLLEDEVAFEFNGAYVLMNVCHRWDRMLSVNTGRRPDLSALARENMDHFLTDLSAGR